MSEREKREPLIRVARTLQFATVPRYATSGSAAFDLHSAISASLLIGETLRVGTGLIFEIPSGYEGQIRARSGLASRGIIIPNAPGTVDSDYRGEVMVVLHNLFCREGVHIRTGDRIAQMVITRSVQGEIIEVPKSTLSSTDRGAGGFGSTGK